MCWDYRITNAVYQQCALVYGLCNILAILCELVWSSSPAVAWDFHTVFFALIGTNTWIDPRKTFTSIPFRQASILQSMAMFYLAAMSGPVAPGSASTGPEGLLSCKCRHFQSRHCLTKCIKNRTNITEPPNSFTSSRGHLVSSFLLSDSLSPLEDEVGKVVSPDAKFAGFNLLLLAPTPPSVSTIQKETLEAHERELELTAEETTVHSRDKKLSYDAILVTNHGGGGPLQARRLIPAERACGCISNGIDGKGGNEWPKVRRAVSSFDDVLKNYSPNSDLDSENLLVEKLFDILAYVWVSLSDSWISESPSPSFDIAGNLLSQ